MKFEVRYAAHPKDFKSYDTKRIREDFHVPSLMTEGEIRLVYSHYDRMIIGGIVPEGNELKLESIPYQMTDNFLDRREIGIINVGNNGRVIADGEEFILGKMDALYIGKGKKDIRFLSSDNNNPARFYVNSSLAYSEFPSKLVKKEEANPVYLGEEKHSNKRVLNQYIVPGIVNTSQLMMGITTVFEGSSWNTMPCHRHELRMEAYFYFDIEEDQAVCHLMGEPDETRPVWLVNEEAVLSPPWSIHTASGTTPYNFIWGMAGSDSEMDGIKIPDLK